jgi:RNA polymerase sigma-70 factor (sigma-E family)
MMTAMGVPPSGIERRTRRRRGREGRSVPAEGAPAHRSDAADDRVGRPVAVDDPLTVLHQEHYRSLVRLATLVVGDVDLAEQAVQDAFVKLQLRWGGLRRPERAPAYLRSAVLNSARSQLRHRRVRERYAARRVVPAVVATPEASALAAADHERIVAALRALPDRQREALTLRYLLDLPYAEAAAAMGVSEGAVKTHVHRGLDTLARLLGEDDR